jgi:hypothetical protein
VPGQSSSAFLTDLAEDADQADEPKQSERP